MLIHAIRLQLLLAHCVGAGLHVLHNDTSKSKVGLLAASLTLLFEAKMREAAACLRV